MQRILDTASFYPAIKIVTSTVSTDMSTFRVQLVSHDPYRVAIAIAANHTTGNVRVWHDNNVDSNVGYQMDVRDSFGNAISDGKSFNAQQHPGLCQRDFWGYASSTTTFYIVESILDVSLLDNWEP